jgi:putative DNA-invertase from lambdoid prophage Rac
VGLDPDAAPPLELLEDDQGSLGLLAAARDVASSVKRLAEMGVRVHCLALGGVDLTSSAGKMTMGVINAVAEFERDLLIERTQAGLARARQEGKKTFGRPVVLDAGQRAKVLAQLAAGAGVSALARQMATSRQTIMRVRDAAAPAG